MSAMTEPVALVLDHVELLHNRQCLDTLEQLAVQLSGGSQLALASRTQPRLPLARLRGQGRLMEVGAADLAIDQSEARALLEGTEVRLAAEHAAELHRRTEGWPAGLYLAALALQAAGTAPNTPAAGVAFAGDDRFIVDYLNSELLSRLPAGQLSFLTRTAVPDRMCGPLCDAVLDTTGSATVLESLAGSNLLLVPLDRRREWYRYHHLFRDLLRAELERREPELVPELHRRAATWCEANGLEETAIDHAQAAGAADQVARLVLQVMQPVWASGRVGTVLGWMEWFEREQRMERYPAVAVHGALIFALLGRATRAEQWAAAAGRASPEGRLPDGSTMESYLAYLRAILCRDGVAEMRRDARLAWDGLSALSPYRATMLHTEALSLLLDGDAERADAVFARAFEAASEAGAPPLAAVVLAERGSIAAGRDDWAQAAALADRALEIIRGGEFDAYWTSALVYAWAARGGPVPQQLECGPGASHAGGGSAAAAHPRPPGGVGPGPAGVGPRLHRPRRPRRRPRRAPAGRRHLPAATRPRRPPRPGRRLAHPTHHYETDRPWRLVAHHRRAAVAAAAAQLPELPGDRRAAIRLSAHGEDPGALDLPKVRRLLPQRGDPPRPTVWSARPVGCLADYAVGYSNPDRCLKRAGTGGLCLSGALTCGSALRTCLADGQIRAE
jgi:tetratricopeptide (TPR) repeat protein